MLQVIRLCVLLAALGPATLSADTAPGADRAARGKYLANGIARCFWCHSPLDNGDPAIPIPAKLGSGDVLDEKAPINAPYSDGNRAQDSTADQKSAAPRDGIGRDGRVHAPRQLLQRDTDGSPVGRRLSANARPIRRAGAKRACRTATRVRQPSVAPVRTATPLSSIQRGGIPRPSGRVQWMSYAGEADGSPVRERSLLAAGDSDREGRGSEVSSFDPTPRRRRARPGRRRAAASRSRTSRRTRQASLHRSTFIQTICTGKVGGGGLSAAMPWVFFRTMTDADLRDIFAYLRSVRPVRHRVNNTDPPTWCPACGRRHGLGELNTASATR
jgi:mono/diheme cytochrome c family protein